MPKSTRPGFSHSRSQSRRGAGGERVIAAVHRFSDEVDVVPGLHRRRCRQRSRATGPAGLARSGRAVRAALTRPSRDTVSSPAFLPASDAALLTVAGTVELAGLVLFYIHYRGGIGGYHRSTDFGYVLALIGSILTVAAGVVAVRAGHDVFHELGASTAPAPPSRPPGPVTGSGSPRTNAPFAPPAPAPPPPGPVAPPGSAVPPAPPQPPQPPGPDTPSRLSSFLTPS